jgi:hypothetical protein
MVLLPAKFGESIQQLALPCAVAYLALTRNELITQLESLDAVYENDIGGLKGTVENQVFTISRPREVHYYAFFVFEIRQLLWRATVKRKHPKVRSAITFIGICDRLSVGRPLYVTWQVENLDRFAILT